MASITTANMAKRTLKPASHSQAGRAEAGHAERADEAGRREPRKANIMM